MGNVIRLVRIETIKVSVKLVIQPEKPKRKREKERSQRPDNPTERTRNTKAKGNGTKKGNYIEREESVPT